MDRQAFKSDRAGKVIRVPGAAGYWAFVPRPLPPDLKWAPRLVNLLSRADRALAELSALARSLPNPHLLIRPFIHQEAVLSSRIEGTRASLSDLYAYEAGSPTLFEIPDDVREVHNYVRALEYGLERIKELPLSLRLLREVHGKLLEGVRGEHRTPGEFRRSQNWIGPPGSDLSTAPFVPPPVHEMHECLGDFEKFLHATSEIPPLARIALAHYQFEAIHPFLDGNGRVGRLLIILLMCLWGLLSESVLYLSAYFDARRDDYYDHLIDVSRKGAWEQWVAFFLEGVAVQALDARARAGRLVGLREEYRGRLQSERASGRLLRVVDFLFARPIITISNMRDALGLWQVQAQRYVQRLEALGILREATGRSRNRIYIADSIIQALQEPMPGSEPSEDGGR
jgi:Fic family protein